MLWSCNDMISEQLYNPTSEHSTAAIQDQTNVPAEKNKKKNTISYKPSPFHPPSIVIFQLVLSLISLILFGEAIASKDNTIALDITPSQQPDYITFASMLCSPHRLGRSEKR